MRISALILSNVDVCVFLISLLLFFLLCILKGVYPLTVGAYKGTVTIMQILLDGGAEVNAINTSGSTALIQV